LEHELEERKRKQSCDQTVQELLRRNRALEEELVRLKENMGAPMASPYSASGVAPRPLSSPDELLLTSTVYDGNLSTGSDATPSPRGSPFSSDYSSLPNYSQQYVPLPNNGESWASTVPCPVHSIVSNPLSLADDYGFIPDNVPTSILTCNNTNSLSISAIGHKDVAKVEYDGVDHRGTISQRLPLPNVRPGEEVNHTPCLDAGFRPSSPPLQPGTPHSHPYMSHHQQQQCAWNVYPM
jgi:hypothetical protein